MFPYSERLTLKCIEKLVIKPNLRPFKKKVLLKILYNYKGTLV